ncbi:hypothetical protein ABI_02890 [Asticcacaulis biprosthecium C19]|uniref:Uncharacterized protein n=1 Tax=Asticcacaulis biprosthecium C19 TaxID=715226 RepID=F4QJ26_9CAUL|nr:hypothetical protein [Asticcacaulis biprosthecium]EGF91857.1 hypothetical protein ABI_02890 [Asticcacaulis biprosthecium C19]
MIKKIAAALIFASVAASAMTLSAPAQAGEGHWSIGKGVQCRVTNGVVVCTKNRP